MLKTFEIKSLLVTSFALKSGYPLRAVLSLILIRCLQVVAQEAPPNDAFAAAIPLELALGVTNTIRGSNLGATKEAGEPKHAGNSGGRSVWYRWTAPRSETVYLDTLGTPFDTLLAVYKGSSPNALSLIKASDDDYDLKYRGESRMWFPASAGVDYYIAVDGYNPGIDARGAKYPGTNIFNAGCGLFALNIWRGPLPPTIIRQPTNRVALLLGESTSFSIATTGEPRLNYQWYKDGQPLLLATNSSCTITGATESSTGVYYVVVSNSLGSATSSNVRVETSPIVFSQHPQSVDSGWGYSISMTGVVASLNPVLYQWNRNGLPLVGQTNNTLIIPYVEIKDAGSYSLVASNNSGVVTSSNAVLAVLPYTFSTIAGNPKHTYVADGLGPEAGLYGPRGITVDRRGNVYFSEWGNHTIRKVAPDGMVTTIAGTSRTAGTNDGPTSTARFSWPEGLVADDSGNLYVLDNWTGTVRKISSEGLVTTIAGIPGQQGWSDGPAASARFSSPCAITRDITGNLLIVEWANETVRKVSPDGFVTTVLGDKAWLDAPTAIAIDPIGNYWITKPGYVVPVASNGVPQASLGGFYNTYGGAMDSEGNYFIAGGTPSGELVHRISPEKRIAKLAGGGSSQTVVDGVGSVAGFSPYSRGTAVDQYGNIYLADDIACVIRKGVPFAVTRLPGDRAVAAGTEVTLDAEVASPGVFHYQWCFEGAPLAGETLASLRIGPVGRTNSGLYSLQISNDFGNSITFYATVRAVFPSVLEMPEITAEGSVRLRARDIDGSLPYDTRNLQVEWRTNLPSGTDQIWQPLISGLTITNGFILLQDTEPAIHPSRFYRIRQQ